jgi:hypothetical protein
VSRLAGCPGWAEFADAALQNLIDQGKLTYSQLDQIWHLNPRVKLSLFLAAWQPVRSPQDSQNRLAEDIEARRDSLFPNL